MSSRLIFAVLVVALGLAICTPVRATAKVATAMHVLNPNVELPFAQDPSDNLFLPFISVPYPQFFSPAGSLEAFESGLSETQKVALDAIKLAPMTQQIDPVAIDPAVLKSASSIRLTLPDGAVVTFSTDRIDERSATDFSWFGNTTSSDDHATVSVREGNAVGSIWVGANLYNIRSLGDSAHVSVAVNQAAYPKEESPDDTSLLASRVEEQGEAESIIDSVGSNIIKVLVLYTPRAELDNGSIEPWIQLAVDETNMSFRLSGVDTVVQLMHSQKVNYVEAPQLSYDLLRLRDQSDGYMDEIHALRQSHNADMVVLLTAGDAQSCGRAATIHADYANAFAVVHQSCAVGNYTFGHEIGHLCGARHDLYMDATLHPYPNGHGYYARHGDWRTIMAYPYYCLQDCVRVPFWSSPSNTLQNELMGTTEWQDNARVMSQCRLRPTANPMPPVNHSMVYIPAGTFEMGCTYRVHKWCKDASEPLHKVALDAYYIDKFEVTNGRFGACVVAGTCPDPQSEWAYNKDPKYSDHPVRVTWEAADQFCRWDGKRLPTEAEWEKAARGDRDTRLYPWGDEEPTCTHANISLWVIERFPGKTVYHNGPCMGKTVRVGSYSVDTSSYGAMDMAGNMWEWVSDWYDPNYYATSPPSNPPGASEGKSKTIRGGRYLSIAQDVTTFNRWWANPATSYSGFRCVRMP